MFEITPDGSFLGAAVIVSYYVYMKTNNQKRYIYINGLCLVIILYEFTYRNGRLYT